MKLSEKIKLYRQEHDMSLRDFAAKCGLSHGYISMLEKELNPRTGLPPVPTLGALNKISSAMGMTLTEFIESVDSMDIFVSDATPEELPEDKLKSEILSVYQALDEDGQKQLLDYAKFLSQKQKGE